MARFVAHNMSRGTRVHCESLEEAQFEIDRSDSDGAAVRPGDHWEILRLSAWRAGSGKVIRTGIGPNSRTPSATAP